MERMGRGGAARPQNTNRAGSSGLAGASGKNSEERSDAEGYDFVSSDEPSLMPSLKFLIALPTPLPSCGKRLAPKINTTITRITRSSGKPRLPMALLLQSERQLYHFARSSRQANPTSAVPASAHFRVL